MAGEPFQVWCTIGAMRTGKITEITVIADEYTPHVVWDTTTEEEYMLGRHVFMSETEAREAMQERRDRLRGKLRRRLAALDKMKFI